MIHCQAMSDRMPEVAAGGRPWSEAESAHLADCLDCQQEWRLVQAAAALGDTAARAVVPDQVGRAVLGRLKARRQWQRTGWVAGLAAAAAVLFLVWPGGHNPPQPVVAPEAFVIPVAELDSLDTAQLETVLENLDAPLGNGHLGGGPPLGELNDVQLERVLHSLEG